MGLVNTIKSRFAAAVANRRALRQRLAHLTPIREAIFGRVLLGSWVALAGVTAILWADIPRGVFFPFGTTLWPAACLLMATLFFRFAKKHKTELGVAFLFQAVAFAATWSQAALLKSTGHGYPQYEGILMVTILLSGLLIGEFFVGAWTFICCVSFQFAVMESNGWKVNAGWSAVYIAAAWLVIQLTREFERFFEANRIAEERQRNAIVAERTRFARDIHDTLAQGFTGIMMQLNAAEQRLGTGSAETRAHIENARELARESLEEARRSVSALASGALSTGTLIEAMEQIGRKLTGDSGLDLDTKLEGQPYALPESCEANLLRIAQEAMTNAVRHSGTKRIGLQLAYKTGSVVLEISDSGRGMSGQEPSGFGVENMRARARQLGGEIQILSDPGRGTRIVVTVPNA